MSAVPTGKVVVVDAGAVAAEALNAGYHAAFLFGAGFAVVAALLGLLVLRPGPRAAVPGNEAMEVVAGLE